MNIQIGSPSLTLLQAVVFYSSGEDRCSALNRVVGSLSLG